MVYLQSKGQIMNIRGNEVRVFDNGGASNDRYTIVIGKSVFAMNDMPFHPAFGFSQYCGEIEQGYNYNASWGMEITDISKLPEDTVKAIIQRFEGEE